MDTTDYQQLKSVMRRTVVAICEETSEETGLTFNSQLVDIILNTVMKQAAKMAQDMEMFAGHAKRKTISPEDVEMLVRRSPQLYEHITNMNSQ